MTPGDESAALHARVRAFASDPAADDFDALALDIARYQDVTRGRRFAAGDSATNAAGIAAVTTDAFRLTRVAVHPASEDVVTFRTSGTTAEVSGRHAMRTTDTYRHVALEFGHRMLLCDVERPLVVALAPEYKEGAGSSLGFMMRAFVEEFDAWSEISCSRWAHRNGAVDSQHFRQLATFAREQSSPLLLLATAFALVELLDGLAGAKEALPAGSVVMPTGGFKGRSRSVSPGELNEAVARCLAVPPSRCIGEYGMTELSSQLYQAAANGTERRTYVAPHWLGVSAVDPVTLERLRPGTPGLARFVDLANVDSAVAVLSRDRIVEHEEGIELLGRQPGAPLRGCSLAIEGLALAAPPGVR